MKLFQKVKMVGLMLFVGLMTAGCQTLGSATENVTCRTMDFIWLSRKDVLTKGTERVIVGNNGAWIALCGKPAPLKK